MQRFIISLLTLFSIYAFAQSENIREFRVESAEFSPKHIQSPTSATLFVDYLKSEISLSVALAMPVCPSGKLCAQVMPEPFEITLPIQDIQKDNCGIFHLVAERDFRPIDGPLHRIELQDVTESHCSPQSQQEALYMTTTVSQQRGVQETTLSKMFIHPLSKNSQVEILHFVRGQFVKGFPDYQKPGRGLLLLSKNRVEFRVDVDLNCTKRICPKMMPLPLLASAPIVQAEEVPCGQITTAVQDLRKQTGSYVEIKVTDYKNSSCRFLVKPTTDVLYKATHTQGDRTFEYEAAFSFERD